MSLLSWSTESRRDIDGIYDYIGRRERRPATADRAVAELIAVCRTYADAFAAGSVLGTARPDLGDDLRDFTHSRWVVVVRPVDNGIEVLRVLDGRRDYPRLFGE